MSRYTTRDVDLLRSERLPSSVNGNPRFRLVCLNATYTTMSDAACSYDVENITRAIPQGQTTRVRLHLTPAGRVAMIDRLPDEPDDEPETRMSRLLDILNDVWHLQDDADANQHDDDNPPARYLVIEWDGGHQQHWATTTDSTPDEIAARAGTDEAGYEECDVHDLDTGQHWDIVPTYRAVPTTKEPTA